MYNLKLSMKQHIITYFNVELKLLTNRSKHFFSQCVVHVLKSEAKIFWLPSGS